MLKRRTRLCVVSPSYELKPKPSSPAVAPVPTKSHVHFPIMRFLLFAAPFIITAAMFLSGFIGLGFNVFLGESRAGIVPLSYDVGGIASLLDAPPQSVIRLFPRFVLNRRYTPEHLLAEKLMLLDGQFFEGCALVCDNRLLFAMDSQADVQRVIDEYIKPYKTENTTVAVLDCNSAIASGLYRAEERKDAKAATDALYGMNVITIESISTTEPVAYITETTADSTLKEGTVSVTSEGENGEMEVTRVVRKINGAPVTEKIVGQTMLTVPVSRIEAHGTKVLSGTGTGSFLRPVPGAVSSGFGYRWGRQHNGTDFFGSIGDPVVAADSGTVSFSGTAEGYGNLIIIDHKNGYETYYGHLNCSYVSTNDKLESGEIIGELGSTGNSTGPHLHFEIRRNGVPLNPADILP